MSKAVVLWSFAFPIVYGESNLEQVERMEQECGDDASADPGDEMLVFHSADGGEKSARKIEMVGLVAAHLGRSHQKADVFEIFIPTTAYSLMDALARFQRRRANHRKYGFPFTKLDCRLMVKK